MRRQAVSGKNPENVNNTKNASVHNSNLIQNSSSYEITINHTTRTPKTWILLLKTWMALDFHLLSKVSLSPLEKRLTDSPNSLSSLWFLSLFVQYQSRPRKPSFSLQFCLLITSQWRLISQKRKLILLLVINVIQDHYGVVFQPLWLP